MRLHSMLLALLTAFAVGTIAPAQPRDVVHQPDVGEAEAGAENVARVLPKILKVDHHGPYPLAALRLDREFWDAVTADSGGRTRNNMFQGLFSGGLLFGIGPYDNLLGVAQQVQGMQTGPLERWTPPPTFAALLEVHSGDPDVSWTIRGQSAEWVRRTLRDTDPDTVIGELEFVYFPLNLGGSAPALGQIAQSMTLAVGGLVDHVVHTFTWEFERDEPATNILRNQYAGADPRLQRDRGSRPLEDQWRNKQMGLGGGAMAGGLGGMAPPPLGPAGPSGAAGPAGPEAALAPGVGGPMAPAAADAAIAAAPAIEATTGPYLSMGAQRYPLARTSSGVPELGVASDDPFEMYAGVERLAQNDGVLTLDYYTSGLGRQEVEVQSVAGDVVARLKSGPAPADGQALAGWVLPKDDVPGEEPLEYAVVVRNRIDTPISSQIAEAVVPLVPEDRNEPPSAMAPAVAPAAMLSVAEMSVNGDLLHVRADVPPVRHGRQQIVPELHIRISDEDGDTIKTLQPTPPEPGESTIFAWDCTDQDGERVDDGRYLLKLATGNESPAGTARSELRYWVDVPLAKTNERLTVRNADAVIDNAGSILNTRADTLSLGADGPATIDYWLREGGRLRISIVDSEGRVVRRLLDEEQAKGHHQATWDGSGEAAERMPEGTYTIHLEQTADSGSGWATIDVEVGPAG